ncbi:MAG TPA: potassium channel family protein [Pyrinomonadaceae bacterium]|nr:potassium channel family protein [Pyrinomonadaceae bacterium]
MFTASGVLVLLFVAYDVYATILDASGRAGPLSQLLNRGVWSIARPAASRFARARRHRLLNLVGPMLMPALIVIYLLLLIVGFALIYYPRMPAEFNVLPEAMSANWIESLYFSGTTLITVGYGDITPRAPFVRLVALIEGASGFALISLAVTYLITVYSALERKRVIALSFYHQADEGADVAGFITHHFVMGRFHGFDNVLRMAARDINELQESHAEHPVVHYFHPVAIHKSTPRLFFLVLETCAVINSCLDANEYPETCGHPEVRTLEASGLHVLDQLVAALSLKGGRARPAADAAEVTRRLKTRYRQTLRQLSEADIKTRRDTAEGWEIYRARREQWETKLHSFTLYLGYDWDEVTGDRNLRYAADDEMDERELPGEKPHAPR